MDKDRWAKIAIEMQGHIDALARIAKREKLDAVSISLLGMPKHEYSIETYTFYIEGEKHYQSNKCVDGKLEMCIKNDTYRTCKCT